ncbi:MAG: class I SAM-dependent methyltransferase [Deltaproteobacteria bacterium]|nr:class I SAM-dependent methyltransferase [Deltaproteobacteria bacterium]
MKVLESVACELADADHVLEIGCGTGELAQMLVSQGSVVHGFDMNAAMIEAANERIQRNHLEDRFKATHMGVDGMDSLPDAFYDAVVSTLVFSELSDDERKYVFKHSARVLKPEGIIVIADEVVPENIFMKLFHKLIRLPMLAMTYLITRTLTTPISDLSGEMKKGGFKIKKEILRHGGSFAMVTGKRSKGV